MDMIGFDPRGVRDKVKFILTITRLCWTVNAFVTIAAVWLHHYAIAAVSAFSLVMSIIVSATIHKIHQAITPPKIYAKPYLEDRHNSA